MKPVAILFLIMLGAFLVHEFAGGHWRYRYTANHTGFEPADIFGFQPERTARRGYR